MSKVDLTPAKLADIKKKAEAAETQGPSPWKFEKVIGFLSAQDLVDEDYHIYYGRQTILDENEEIEYYEVRDNDNCRIAYDLAQEEAEYIAEANPATVLAMVQEIESLQIALRQALNQLRTAYRKETGAGQ